MAAILPVAPNLDAAKKFAGKRAVASAMRTGEWSSLPLALRQRAFFSAGVTNAKLLAHLQGDINSALNIDGAFLSRDAFVSRAKTYMAQNGYAVEGTSLRDITSNKRLSLIYDFNVEQARQQTAWEQGMDEDVLRAFPAQELFRIERREIPRDWALRWNTHGGKFYERRMIALKTDDVWTRISRFGTPYPPFDFNSGMGVRDIRRKEAIRLKLIEAHEDVLPDAAMGKYLAETDIANIPQNLRDALMQDFEKEALHVEIVGSKLKLIDRNITRATWSDYGYTDAYDWRNPKITEELVSPDAALLALHRGESVETPVGKIIYDDNVLRHWEEKEKDAKNIQGRLERYGIAKDAAATSREIWEDDGQYGFINIYLNKDGQIKGVATFSDKKTRKSETFFVSDLKTLNSMRHGKRIYSR